MGNTNTSLISKLIRPYLKECSKDEQALFFQKIIGESEKNLDILFSYIKNPKTFLYTPNEFPYDISIGDTIFIACDTAYYGSSLRDRLKTDKIIDGLLSPATIVDFNFIPEVGLTVYYHDMNIDKKTQTRITREVNLYNVVLLDLV